ncbi:hypothetical protein BVC93_10965 [Mycobacterium sp. MS1601]|uniref:LacI family DNA-binding transcriptional regulator n=1 Tax=Mycobacterium sp. MS1601 TaxID=1936029 RepID=UPI0009798020|nr:LacI family DNA-binding transcriptional regulator [Mycobacterium sp. MS1601]AQA02866.1 hypothetical protein BVC93_10965 [Mycobacterium sp. MS1601]
MTETDRPRGFQRPPRLTDIAQRAGVSIKSVSRVLNDEPYVTEELRAKVLVAVEDLGYVTDNRARVLRTNKSGFLGIIVPDIRNGFFAGLIHQFEKRLSVSGQTMLLGISGERPEREEKYLKLFRQQRVDGLVVLPTGAPSLADVATRVPTVVLDRTHESIHNSVDHVLVRNKEAAYTLTQHLIDKRGLQRVAMVTGEATISSVRERQLGYLEAIEGAGLEPLISAGHTSREAAAEGAIDLMSRIEPPFGVLATGNRMFWAVMTAANHLRLSVPRDVAVVTFDGIGDTSSPGLPPTQAVLPVPTMVARALQLLTERENDPGRPYQSVSLDCDIEYGVTCGCIEPVSASGGPRTARRRSAGVRGH